MSGDPATEAPQPARRRRLRIAGLAVLALLVLDWSRPPERQWTAWLELRALAAYRAALSPRLAQVGVRCRFQPSCSRYAEGAIAADGALIGSVRALGRLTRCGPWTTAGTYDPP